MRVSPNYTKCNMMYNNPHGRLAQLVRASLLHREGQGFESLSAHSSLPEQGFLFSAPRPLCKVVSCIVKVFQSGPICDIFSFVLYNTIITPVPDRTFYEHSL